MSKERRISPRVFAPYFARVWGIDAAGRLWEEDVFIENLSAGGASVRLKRNVRSNTVVSVAVRLSIAADTSTPALRLAARGVVVRTEPHPEGTCDVAIEFIRRRLFMKPNAAHALC